jgi:hypothetical protein
MVFRYILIYNPDAGEPHLYPVREQGNEKHHEEYDRAIVEGLLLQESCRSGEKCAGQSFYTLSLPIVL